MLNDPLAVKSKINNSRYIWYAYEIHRQPSTNDRKWRNEKESLTTSTVSDSKIIVMLYWIYGNYFVMSQLFNLVFVAEWKNNKTEQNKKKRKPLKNLLSFHFGHFVYLYLTVVFRTFSNNHKLYAVFSTYSELIGLWFKYSWTEKEPQGMNCLACRTGENVQPKEIEICFFQPKSIKFTVLECV